MLPYPVCTSSAMHSPPADRTAAYASGQGPPENAQTITGCRLTQETGVQNALGDMVGTGARVKA